MRFGRVLEGAFLLTCFLFSCNIGVSGGRPTPVKVITTAEGDVFDCMDIYKQPAFDHPLLKDHKILTRPVLWPAQGLPKEDSEEDVISSLLRLEGGGCPEGTVPIPRHHMSVNHDNRTVIPTAPLIGAARNRAVENVDDASVAWAIMRAPESNYYGVAAALNVYGVHPLWEQQQSGSLIWAINRSPSPGQDSMLQAGWFVSPRLFGDHQTRIYAAWTATGEKGFCVNFQCPGFVQVSRDRPLGRTLWPTSTYKGRQFIYPLHIYKDTQSNWWLATKSIDHVIGYWPARIFKGFDYATEVHFGGYISCKKSDRQCPPMGNGHSPRLEPDDACYTNQILALDERGRWDNITDPIAYNNVPECYNVGVYHYINNQRMYQFHFGGPPCHHW